MNYIEETKLKNADSTYNMVIEILKGGKNKVELVEPNFDTLVQVKKSKLKYPFYYGCFPQTIAGDKEPLDVVLLTKKKRNELDIVAVKPIGVVKTLDNGEVDDKVFVVDATEELKHLHKFELLACKFLKKYKGKKANMVIDKIFYDEQEAKRLITEANNFYNKIKDKKSTTTDTLKIF